MLHGCAVPNVGEGGEHSRPANSKARSSAIRHKLACCPTKNVLTCFQSAGVATGYLAASCSESMTRSSCGTGG